MRKYLQIWNQNSDFPITCSKFCHSKWGNLLLNWSTNAGRELWVPVTNTIFCRSYCLRHGSYISVLGILPKTHRSRICIGNGSLPLPEIRINTTVEGRYVVNSYRGDFNEVLLALAFAARKDESDPALLQTHRQVTEPGSRDAQNKKRTAGPEYHAGPRRPSFHGIEEEGWGRPLIGCHGSIICPTVTQPPPPQRRKRHWKNTIAYVSNCQWGV